VQEFFGDYEISPNTKAIYDLTGDLLENSAKTLFDAVVDIEKNLSGLAQEEYSSQYNAWLAENIQARADKKAI